MSFSNNDEDTSEDKAHDRMISRRQRQIRTALSRVGQTEEGRLVLWHILFDVCKLNEDAFGGEEVVYRHMGRRAVALQVLAEIEEADIAIHLNMIKDNKNRTESEMLILQQMIDEEKAKGEENV